MPEWGGNDRYSGEREMLYDVIDADEVIQALISCNYRAGEDTYPKSTGVAAATNRRVILLAKGGIFGNKDISEIPICCIEKVTHSVGMLFGGVQINRSDASRWHLENVSPKDSAKQFYDCIRNQLDAFRVHDDEPSSSPTSPDAGGTAAFADSDEPVRKSQHSERQKEIDEQWHAVKPEWWGGEKVHGGEQRMLYDVLGPGELICALVSCTYRVEQNSRICRGVAVATTDHVILLYDGAFGGKDVTEIPYSGIERIVHHTGMFYGGVRISGPGTWELRIEGISPKNSAKPFAKSLRSQLEAFRAENPDTSSNSLSSDGDESVKWSKAYGRHYEIDAQWYAVMPDWSGGRGMHTGEREMLYEILDPGEVIHALVGGTYRAEQDTNRIHKHNGVAVATSKRVIFLDKGVFGSKEVSEMPYRSVEGITHSTGMFYGGVQITGLGTSGWRIEDVNPKDSAQSFADSVRSQVEALRAEGPRPSSTPIMSAADELAKWAKLFQDGILTQAEFDAKKQQLLGL